MAQGVQLAQVDIGKEWNVGFGSLGNLTSALLPKFLILGGVIFFIMVIIAGLAVLRGAGSEDAQAKEKWHQILTYGAIGLIIMFGALWVLQIINYITDGALNSIL